MVKNDRFTELGNILAHLLSMNSPALIVAKEFKPHSTANHPFPISQTEMRYIVFLRMPAQVDDRAFESLPIQTFGRPTPPIILFANLAMLRFFMARAIHQRFPRERPQRLPEKLRHIRARLNPSPRQMVYRIGLTDYHHVVF